MTLPSSPSSVFKFEVRVVAKECPPEYMSLKVTVGQEWNLIGIEKMPAEIHAATNNNSRNVHM